MNLIEICPPVPRELNEAHGIITSPNMPILRDGTTFDVNCSWVIRAPPSQVSFFSLN